MVGTSRQVKLNMPRKKKSARRRRDNAISITGVTQSVIVGNAISQMTMGTDLWTFLTAGWLQPNRGVGASWELTLSELVQNPHGRLGQDPNSTVYTGGTAGLVAAVKKNFNSNAASAIPTIILTPIIFRVGKRFLRGSIRDGNKLLKMAGVRQMVKM